MEGPSTPGAATVFNGLDIVIDPASCLGFGPDLGIFHPLQKTHYVIEDCAVVFFGTEWPMNQNIGQREIYMLLLGKIRRVDAPTTHPHPRLIMHASGCLDKGRKPYVG